MSRFAAVVLAAGLGSRYRASGGEAPSKLVARLEGVPLVRRVVASAIDAGCGPVIVVTGHAQGEIGAALQGFAIDLVHNADYASGLASSLRAGIARVPADAPGAAVLLGDMPGVSAGLLRPLIARAEALSDWDAVAPTFAGRRGNPVVLARRLFPAVARLEGDAGARQLLKLPAVAVHDIAVDDAAVTLDIDEVSDLRLASEALASGA